MEKDIIKKWDANKEKLYEWFLSHKIEDVRDYKYIVQAICEVVLELKTVNNGHWNKRKLEITEVKHQEYQGYSVFVIYFPSSCDDLSNFIITNNEYGSCPGCDTLEAILKDPCWEKSEQLLSERQAKMLMTLSLHLVQKMIRLEDNTNDRDIFENSEL